MKFALVVILCFISPFEVQALSCYQCTHFDRYYSGYGEWYDSCDITFSNAFDHEYSCTENNPDTSVQVCPEGYKCGLVEGYIVVKSDKFSGNWCNFTAAATVRKCMKAEIPEDGCMLDDVLVEKEVKSVMNFEPDAEVTVSVEGGDICYCSTSFCDPRCGEKAYRILNFCVQKWVFCAVGAGLLFFIVAGIFSCICCCRKCCCCCKSKASTGDDNSVRPSVTPRSDYTYQRLHNNGPV